MNSSPKNYVAVIDDDESICRSLSRLLRASHIHAVTYLSAEAFLADTKHPAFDCLLLDIQLGGISGLELARRLGAVKNATPVIFITAHDSPVARADAESLGCAGYFLKTDAGDALLAAIRRVTEASGLVNGAKMQ